MRRHAPAGGFSLLEVILAVSIAAALLVILSGGVRVGLAAWQRTDERTAQLDHTRGLVLLLEHALAGAFPYRMDRRDAQEPHVLFDGRRDRLTFATLSPPWPGATATAFSVVRVAADRAGLTVHQQALPNQLAPERLPPVLVDARTAAVRFRYLGPGTDAWRDTWDTAVEKALPRAVQITLVGADTRSGPETFIAPVRVTGP